MSLITIVGASGRQGLAQVRQSLAAGYNVRALSRQQDPFAGIAIKGIDSIEVRPIDLFDRETFAIAFEETDYIFYTHPLQSPLSRSETLGSLGQCAAELGVKRVVWNTSSWIPDRPGDPFTYGENTKGINALWRSGVPGTVFGSVLFMDNLLTNWARPFIVDEGRYVYPHGPQLEANWISLDDVARFMLASLERPDLEGAWINIGGPERLKGAEVARTLGEALGKPVRYDPCTPQEFGDLIVQAAGNDLPQGERADFAAGMAAFYEYNNTAPTRPFEVDMNGVYSRFPELEGKLETLAEWAPKQSWSKSNSRPAFG